MGARRAQQPGQPGGESGQQEVRRGVHVPGGGEQRGRYVRGRRGRQGARGRDDGTVLAPGEDDGERRGQSGIDEQGTGVDPVRVEGVADVAARVVVAHAAGERHPQTEAGRAARHDRGRAAEGEGAVGDELFALPEGEGGVEGTHDDVGIGVSDDEQVEAVRHGSSLEVTAGGGRAVSP